MLREQRPFKFFNLPATYMKEFVREAKGHGLLYVPIRNKQKGDYIELVVFADDAAKIQRIYDNLGLDYVKAEAVADLIHAKTRNFAVQSAKNLSGVLSEKVSEIKGEIFEVLSRIVAGIDFPEDVAEPEYSYLIESFEKSVKKIDEILACTRSSNILRQGIKVAIVGRPNVGKSSLFNTLLNTERAIVTDIAGTTRDVIKETLDMDVAVTLIDTAGIRDSEEVGKVEEIGIEYSKQSADEADLILFLYDASKGMNDDDRGNR